jgi:hypothetical protein
MKLYLIHGNVYYEGYGHMEHTFGIYTDKDKAEVAKKVVIEKLYEKEKDNELSYVDDISDIEVGVVEIESDMAVDITLGGFYE